jgi:hypothetical protein
MLKEQAKKTRGWRFICNWNLSVGSSSFEARFDSAGWAVRDP